MILKVLLLITSIFISTILGAMIGYRIERQEKQGLLEYSFVMILAILVSTLTTLII